jgi:hypothetical protein
MTKQQLIEKILQTLMRQKFADWYNDGGAFDKWIRQDNDAPSDAEIEQDIARLFNLN